ncbi:MAG: hypothetical protein D6765_05635, partial [Bacteroidetes bacterium]
TPALAAHPNPAPASALHLRLTLDREESCSLTLHDLQGRLLWTFRQTLPAGTHDLPVHWQHRPAPGLVLARLETASGHVALAKVVLTP